jgi:hypothetical protein
MIWMKPNTNLLLGLILAGLACGCGTKAGFNADLAIEKRELGEVYDGYMGYLKSHQKPPADLSQLAEFEAAYSVGIRALREGKYKAIWGISEMNSGTVLAYQAAPTEQGRVVLMGDGTVRVSAYQPPESQ